MISNPTFDPETLLIPFDGDNPAGVNARDDLSPSSLFLQMKDARARARRKERALDVDSDVPSSTGDWVEVVETGCIILSEAGKDLEVSAWLIEALLRVDGLAGLFTGLRVAQGLVERFWASVYPLPDELGDEARLLPFIMLNGDSGDGMLTQPLRKIPLTNGALQYALWQYEQAGEISALRDPGKRDARITAGAATMEQLLESVRETSPSFFVNLLDNAAAARHALDAVSHAFEAHVGRDAPPANGLRLILQEIVDAVTIIGADRLPQSAAATIVELGGAAVSVGPADADVAPGKPSLSGIPVNREDAFRQILQISAYFREKEPHSPLSYSLEEAVRRGRLPLPKLLDELIMDADARQFFFIAAGVKPDITY